MESNSPIFVLLYNIPTRYLNVHTVTVHNSLGRLYCKLNLHFYNIQFHFPFICVFLFSANLFPLHLNTLKCMHAHIEFVQFTTHQINKTKPQAKIAISHQVQ